LHTKNLCPEQRDEVCVDRRPPARDGACGECSVCKAVETGNFIDLIEIDAASNTGVDNVRDLIEHVKFAPSVGKYKVFIIDEVHMLSKGAFNALLKTLEEPPKHAIFILATTEIQKVPATIISRTQRFDFKILHLEDLKNHLKFVIDKENLNYGKDIIDLLAEHAQGGARDALSLLDKNADE
jgi:DNA polymerase-3 subunit gamma/tau